MIDFDPYTAYSNRWFTSEEVRQVDKDLLGRERTGENYYWINSNGPQILFSGPKSAKSPATTKDNRNE